MEFQLIIEELKLSSSKSDWECYIEIVDIDCDYWLKIGMIHGNGLFGGITEFGCGLNDKKILVALGGRNGPNVLRKTKNGFQLFS